MKPTMILLVGPIGCGKSTFRKKYLGQFPCISPDDFIIGRWSPDKVFLAWNYAEKVANLILRSGQSFVVDAQFVSSSVRNQWVKMARLHQFGVVALCFRTPWVQIVANHNKRGERGGYGKIPIDVVQASHDKFLKSISGPSNWFLFDKVMTIKWGSRKDKTCALKALNIAESTS